MFYVGIDIPKNTHWASIMSSNGEIICELFSCSNDNSGFQKSVSKLENLLQSWSHLFIIYFYSDLYYTYGNIKN